MRNLPVILFVCAAASALFVSCDKWWGGGDKPPVDNVVVVPKLILSIPDWAMGKGLTNFPMPMDSLRQLHKYDSTLHQLLSDTTLFNNFTYTKKFNPCCPCTSSGTTCCACPRGVVMASPSFMNVSVKTVDANNVQTPVVATPLGGVDQFVVPDTYEGFTLVIDGKSIPGPITFTIEQ